MIDYTGDLTRPCRDGEKKEKGQNLNIEIYFSRIKNHTSNLKRKRWNILVRDLIYFYIIIKFILLSCKMIILLI